MLEQQPGLQPAPAAQFDQLDVLPDHFGHLADVRMKDAQLGPS
jgi:hypothetical protein